ncbi:Clavaminate synthase-like protein [Gigaspora margarita]|uniref:Clavaminate synthase-like protein n=1 Tax=Gigaspora margarita TaxID=4874 RepID=A0A8H4B4P9_GIGMA|nr:Clavaminate synthase-like protein [Gigaspora margarita]
MPDQRNIEKSPEGVVILDYNDILTNVDVSDSIEEAFGAHSNCLGIILIKNLPKDYAEKRIRLLRLASVFAKLPEDIKNKTVHKESFYSCGWSCGKEVMGGKLDYLKGSYYANPKYDIPNATPKQKLEFPMYCHPNIWPKDALPEFEHAFKDLGCFIMDVAKLLARACDIFVSSRLPSAKQNYLEKIIVESHTTKARLLHYFPTQLKDDKATRDTRDSDEIEDSWCGWHVDHSSITGLTSAMYLNESDSTFPEVQCPDPSSGLYIKTKSKKTVKVSIPKDYLAFQLGEAMQLASGNNLLATPHMVKGISSNVKSEIPINVISRNTFAVFMEPPLDEMVGDITFADFAREVLQSHY